MFAGATTIASLLTKAEEFFVTGFVSLAIVLATVRAYLEKLTGNWEQWSSFTGVFFFCLVVTLGLYAYRYRRQAMHRHRRSHSHHMRSHSHSHSHSRHHSSRRLMDEERGIHASFRILPIVLDGRHLQTDSPMSTLSLYPPRPHWERNDHTKQHERIDETVSLEEALRRAGY